MEYIEKQVNGFWRFAKKALAELRAEGSELIVEKPRLGVGGAKIAFLHTKSTFGALIELCEREE